MSIAGLSLPFVRPLEQTKRVSRFKSLFSCDLAMDLGTANTLIYRKGEGIVLNEPSVVAVEEDSGTPIAIGSQAKSLFGKTSKAIRCVRPLKDGVIADFELAQVMIQRMLKSVQRGISLLKPRLVIGVPSGITQVEKRAVIDAALGVDARVVHLVEEPMAAALGAGLPVDRAIGNMIVDIGGGTTEVAILSLGGAVYSQSIRVAGDEMDEAIQRYVRRHLGLAIGLFEAERIKILLGSALPGGTPRTVTVSGRDTSSGVPCQVEVSDELVRHALSEPVAAVISSVSAALEQTTPEIAHDIVLRGVHLAGGGALLRGLAERLQRETGIEFRRDPDPLTCVVRGVGRIIDDLKELQVLCIS